MPRRRRSRRKPRLGRIVAAILVAPIALYLAFALILGTLSVNRGWNEPADGVTVYLADNGIHTDIVMPVAAAGVSWDGFITRSDMKAAPPGARWLAFGAGDRGVYLDTPTWWDLSPRALWAALRGGERVMHVEWVADPAVATRTIRLTPAQYRRLWASVRASFAIVEGRPRPITGAGYTGRDAFYDGVGKASAVNTCNQWTASMLRSAGVKAPIWSPLPTALTARYRPVRGRSD